MARAAGNKAAKATAAGPPSTSTKFGTDPPKPFIRVPSSLQPLASTLPINHVYLVHLDRTPVDLKQRVSLIPLLLNLAIVTGLVIRVVYAAPTYLQQLITIFGYDTAYSVDTKTSPVSDLMSTVTSRFILIFVDYALFALLGSWPKEFFFGSKASRYVGPWTWRRRIRFEKEEVIVRRARNWDTPLLAQNDDVSKSWSTQDELAIKFKIEPAMQPGYAGKNGLLLLDKDWDLDFKAMVDAHRMIRDGRLRIEDLDGIALVYYQRQWLSWKVREDAVMPAGDPKQEAVLKRFREKLTALGREDTFYRWIEIVQYETSQPKGFTQARQTAAMQDLHDLLTARGVDADAFYKDIGGPDGLPGLGQNSRG